jgi:pSer/pThr/pTyr-binding forkhead associated (FHA) protein
LSTFRPRDVSTGTAEGSAEPVPWSLRFISGKYQGGEFPLRANREIVIGRSSELDMVLVEDMVSRKHAKISTDEHTVSIQDLGSTNGTFVNGEKIRHVDLKDGDRILIGTSIIKLVALSGETDLGTTGVMLSETEARSRLQVTGNRRTTTKSMSGSIEEIPLPDLIQLLSTSKKSGVLMVRTDFGVGKLFLRKGQIYHSSIDDSPDSAGRKAVFRMLTWEQGFFELEPPDEREVTDEMQDSTEGLLMEGMRQLDEYKVLIGKLPPLDAIIGMTKPLTAKLRDLGPEELDVFQSAMGVETLRQLLDASSHTDLTIAERARALFEKNYLTVA